MELSSELPMTNLKPGDRVERTFTVANDGSIAFDYKVRTRFVSGDTEFFDVLQLTVKDGDTVIYDGALHLQQQEIALGRLAADGENELDLSVKFPEEAGNEYQGKAATIAFAFSAYAEEPSNGGGGGSNPPGEGPNQPNDPTPGNNGNPPSNPGTNPGQPTEEPSVNPSGEEPDPSTPEQPENPALPQPQPQPEESPQPQPPADPRPGPGDGGSGMIEELPQTANPWYNLILISLFATVGTGMFLRKSRRE